MAKSKNKSNLLADRPDIAAQWHPSRNGDLTPDQVVTQSHRKVWWLLPYDDATGKHFDFEWQATIESRVQGKGCPFLAGKAVWPGFNDLASQYPKIAAQWHYAKNGDLTPDRVTAYSRKNVWWILRYSDPQTGKVFVFEWKATINKRTSGKQGCPYLTGHKVYAGFNDLQTTRAELAVQWHPRKNGDLTPDQVTEKSNRKVWWILPYDDPVSGQHIDFEWQATVKNRVDGAGCPYLTGYGVWRGYNDLVTRYPDIAAQWDYSRNNGLRPENVLYSSLKKVWWRYDYVDPQTGKQFSFSWQSKINDRTVRGSGCPCLSSKAVWPGYNDLATIRPDIAAQWHPTRNAELLPTMVTCSSAKKVWWLLPYDDVRTGKHFDFEWRAAICNRSGENSGCPFISGKAVWPGFNDLRARNPDLADEWDCDKNGRKAPERTYYQSKNKVWWKCPICGKAWRTSVFLRSHGVDCRCRSIRYRG